MYVRKLQNLHIKIQHKTRVDMSSKLPNKMSTANPHYFRLMGEIPGLNYRNVCKIVL